jgi:hypothetical protein
MTLAPGPERTVQAASAPSAQPVADPARRPDRVWIAWESQRRSLNLSARLGARLFLCLDEDRGWLRYPSSILKTVRELRTRKGSTVLVQNPSMVLAALACLLKKPFGYALAVDRHSNFAYLAGGRAGLKRRLSDLLSNYTLRNADVTIVTNGELAARVERAGGRAFVLPDPFPDMGPAPASPDADPSSPKEILFVSSWAFDEPIAETVEACRRLQGEAVVRITGRPKPAYARLLREAPPNFIPTGFLSEEEYLARMAASDAVMAVTNRAATLVCGGYEGAVLGKPLILGNSQALRAYFDTGCVYTDGSAADVERSIRELLADLPRHRDGIRGFHARRAPEWDARLRDLERLLDRLTADRERPA